METYYVVRYTGPFGFIKPWTAVRDERTFSQQFLTQSIIEGMRIKLGVSAIVRHRLRYDKIDQQQERTQARAYTLETRRKMATREQSVLVRGIMLNPEVHLAFESKSEAHHAATQHICLCRNEDVLLPDATVYELSATAFSALPGFELRFGEGPTAMMVGYNRFKEGEAMYGTLEITGTPVGHQPYEGWN